MRIEVVHCPAPGDCDLVSLDLADAATVADALAASGMLGRHGLRQDGLRVGIWGSPCAADAPLREQDRVEIYRPLQVDPMQARRLRQQQQQEQFAAGRDQRPKPQR